MTHPSAAPAGRERRLLLVSKSFWPCVGGVEETVRDIARFASPTWDVTVLAVGEDRHSSTVLHEGYTVVRVARLARLFSTPLSFGLGGAFARLVRAADVVHLHSPYPPAELVIATTLFNAPLVVTYHFDVVRQRILSPVHRPLLNAVLSKAGRIVCSNPNMVDSSSVLAPHRAKTTVIPFGIDFGALHLTAQEEAEVAQRRADRRRPSVLFVGRLVYYKGVDVLIRAMVGLDAELVIVGSGPLESRLKDLAGTLGVAGQVRFMSYLPDAQLRLQYHLCDLFVLPSVARSEAFGLVLLEAMCAAKPLVTTELRTGTSWVNQHRETGLVVPARDASALHDAIASILGDPVRARGFGERAASRVQSVFSRETFAQRHLEMYETLRHASRQPAWHS